jgi:hypothetical protein
MNYYLKDGADVYAYDDYQVAEQGYPLEPMVPITEEEAMAIANPPVPEPL